jgi:TRAP-type C4-dicarboxylate transport system substrate-binding protein
MTHPRKIRWLIAHQPQELFVRTATAFSQELAKYCGNELEVEILTYPDYVAKYGEIDNMEKLTAYDETNVESLEQKTSLQKGMDAFWSALEDGAIDMSQTQVGQVARHHFDFMAIDLPYIFDNHEHVSRVVDGEIGQQLCRELGEISPVRGLAFTYSGGYRVVGSDEPIMSLDDLQGLRVVVENPLSLGNAVEKLGATTVQVTPSLWKKLDLIGKGEADAVETTYLRFAGKHVFKTNHSVFMTTILVSNKFWATLTEDQQHAFTMAARAAAIIERQWALEDSDRFEREAVEKGVTLTDISEQDTARLKKASQHSYVKVNGMFSQGLLSRIRKA